MDETGKRREEMAQQLRGVYGQVFNSPMGRIALTDLAFRFCLASTTLTPGDVHTTMANEGSRRVVLYIMEMAGLTNYLKMEEILSCRTLQKPGKTRAAKPAK